MSKEENPLALVIEDDLEQQKIFSKAVEMAGFSVEIIGDGSEAIQRLDEVIPSLIVLDLHLPGTSGDEILRHIRAQERLASVSVILATANPILAESLSAESDLILLKPIRTNTMIGKSLNRGANAAGKVARHPRVRVSDMRYVWKGPGCTTAAKAYVNPKTR